MSNKNKFKPNDRVICVNNNGCDLQLILNKRYIVYDMEDDFILINKGSYYASRFELDKNHYREEKLKRILNV